MPLSLATYQPQPTRVDLWADEHPVIVNVLAGLTLTGILPAITCGLLEPLVAMVPYWAVIVWMQAMFIGIAVWVWRAL